MAYTLDGTIKEILYENLNTGPIEVSVLVKKILTTIGKKTQNHVRYPVHRVLLEELAKNRISVSYKNEYSETIIISLPTHGNTK